MIDQGGMRNKPVPSIIYGLAAVLATALILGLAAFVSIQPAAATRAIAQQTGLPCGRCHVNPAGGGQRTAFGNAFAANGNKVPSTTKADKPSAPGVASPGKPSVAGGRSPSSPPTESSSPSVAASTSIVLDYAQAQAWSLRYPFYSHFLYSPDDYRD
jgi:hypothetical protein